MCFNRNQTLILHRQRLQTVNTLAIVFCSTKGSSFVFFVEEPACMTNSDLPVNAYLQQLGVEYQFRVVIVEALDISSAYEDIFCQFNFLHQHHEAYSTEPMKNQGSADLPLELNHTQNVTINSRLLPIEMMSPIRISRSSSA
jgi:hypothetical protein